MRYDIEELIDIVRVETENQDVSETIGIKDTEIIRYLNIATRQLQSKIVGRSPKEFSVLTTLEADTSSGRPVYNLPEDSFMRSKVTSLWVDDYLRKQVYVHNISVDSNSSCCGNKTCRDYYCYQYKEKGYAIVGNKIYLTGDCEGEVKVFYVKTVPELQKSILKIDPISAVDMQGGILQISSDSSFDSTLIKSARRYCLVDEEGNQVVQNIKIDQYNSTLNQLNLSTSNASNSVTFTGNLYLVRGRNSSTHCEFEPLAQDYITRYAIAKVLQRDGSSEYNVHSADLVALLQEIIDAYTSISDDVMSIPQFPED